MSKLPDIKTKFPEWYQEVIYQAELADQAPVRGCIVIRPYGNAIWENIKNHLDKKIKDTGHQNAIFPLLIPESFLKKEADHVEGFAPELAIVTHAGGKELAEPLVVRPTSETMVHHMFAQWINSWRDLPLKINQWANVVRWEMRPRAFLRTSEFFWQEGHTAHTTQEEALEETLLMLEQYRDMAENLLAIPVITGQKSEGEKFPGADSTYTFEAFMPDGKALQMGTSHMLSQTFCKSFDMQYQDKEGKMQHPWLTSWGSTTRLIGAMVMTHGDEKGLVLPPQVAPYQAVIVPFYKTDEDKIAVLAAAEKIKNDAPNVRILIDTADLAAGKKLAGWEMKGVPFRIEIGPRDLQNNHCMVASRIVDGKEKISLDEIAQLLPQKLETFQATLFDNAKDRMDTMWKKAETLEEAIPLSEGNFIQVGHCGSRECEDILKKHKLSIRCVLEDKKTLATCYECKKESYSDVIIARSY